MTYEALARKWRPQVFDDIVEQQQVTQTLKNAITSGRIHHAYLFTGPRGTGKTTTARILAKALNCESGPTPTPCNQCQTCIQITHGSHLDVLEIDAASNTGVDNIRDLREAARYVPASAHYKIYIIDEVHRLSKAAFDALLKTLEEPPESVIFIFATTEPNEVPATVRSRTLRFDFRLISQDPLRQALARIAEVELIKIDDDALAILATEAAGSMRDGQSLLDQMAGYTGDLITGDLVYEALGLVDSTVLFEFTDAVAACDPERTQAVITSVSKAGRDLLQFARQLSEHLKRLMFARALGDKFTDEALSADATKCYRETAGNHDENDLLRLMMMTVEVANRLKKVAQPRLEMELLAMRAARMDRSIDIRTLADQLKGGAQGTVTLGGSAPIARPSPAPTQGFHGGESKPPSGSYAPNARTPIPSAVSGSGGSTRAVAEPASTAVMDAPEADQAKPARVKMDGASIDFSPIFDRICEARPTLQAILGQAELVKTGAGTVDLNVYKGSTFHQRQLAQKPIRDLIHAEIARALGEGLRVTIHVKSEERPGAGNGSPQRKPGAPANGALAADHNLQEIIRRFDGEIVG
jgi:DNA polymerase-3 subunit gamma/tau